MKLLRKSFGERSQERGEGWSEISFEDRIQRIVPRSRGPTAGIRHERDASTFPENRDRVDSSAAENCDALEDGRFGEI
jgi:hypothetical protein